MVRNQSAIVLGSSGTRKPKISWFIIKINRFIEPVFCNQYSLLSRVAGNIDDTSAKAGVDVPNCCIVARVLMSVKRSILC